MHCSTSSACTTARVLLQFVLINDQHCSKRGAQNANLKQPNHLVMLSNDTFVCVDSCKCHYRYLTHAG